jgi:integrase
MPRTLRDAKLDTRNARDTRLKERREPYWRTLSEGLALGYRKGSKGGTWIARHYSTEHGRRYQALGTADDVADADGEHVLSFAQAQESARKWFGDLGREDAGETKIGPYSVADALDDYLKDYDRRGGKGMGETKHVTERHIRPALGSILLTRLTADRIEAWQHAIASAPPLARTGKDAEELNRRPFDPTDRDAVRKRRSTANRVLTVLKAALNHAYRRRKVASPHAWQSVKPYRGVESAKVRYLTDAEAKRLVNASPMDLRAMVTAALLTGARYGELAALRAGDFDPDAGTLYVAESKGGKPRHIVITDEGRKFLDKATAGKARDALLYVQKSGAAWGPSHQTRPMREACTAAKIKPTVGFHILRHTYASRLAMRGVPMQVIAQQLGHADTRMTEKHYAHIAPSYVAETVRAAFGTLGIVPKSKPASIATRR